MTGISNLHRLVLIGRLCARLIRHHLSGNRERFDQTLFDTMFQLGGVYIKFLQALVIRSDLFTDQTLAYQIKVYENVSTEEIDLKAVLVSKLGEDWQTHILSFDTIPFAAGSFGQVYRAKLQSGKDVIIKILRPSLAQTLYFDLRLLGIVAWWINTFKPDGQTDMAEIFRDFRHATAAETFYLREAAFAHELYQRFQNHSHISIPYTYVELCRDGLIIQDYMGGISLAEIIAKVDSPVVYVKQQLGSDLDTQLQALGYEMLSGIFRHPTVFGDPHPGNIKLLPDNRIGLIDFGMVSQAPKNRAGLFALVEEYAKIYSGNIDIQGFSMALLGMFSGKLISSIEAFGRISSNPTRANLILAEVAKSAETTFHSNRGPELEYLLSSGKFLLAFSRVINEGNRFGLRLHFEAANFMRSSNMFMSLIAVLGRRTEVLENVYTRVVNDIKAEGLDLNISSRPAVQPEQASEVLSDWLDRVATSDPILYRRINLHMRGIGHV